MLDKFQLLQEYNFWGKKAVNTGYIRKNYIFKIFEGMDSPQLIKVLVGQRRVGKSYILKQIIHTLIQEHRVPPQNILYLNFENEDFSFVQNKDDLKRLVELYIQELKPVGKIYLFFDEIQEISGWEKLVNSYRTGEKREAEVCISGSNSKMLSSELSTYLSGRYIEFEIFPFSFLEFVDFYSLDINKTNLLRYVHFSGLAEVYNLPNRELQTNFIKSLKDAIILHDVVKRYHIKQVALLEQIFLFLVNNIGNLSSLNSIRKKLLGGGVRISTATLSNYVKYFSDVFVFHGISRFDVHGKKVLEGEKKYYVNDLGFLNFLYSSFEGYISKKIENYVYNCLRSKGWSVYVGNVGDVEIDFIAEKQNQKIYIQVAYLLSHHQVIEREYLSLRKVSDSWPKYVVSMDDIRFPTDDFGIIHIHVWELEKVL